MGGRASSGARGSSRANGGSGAGGMSEKSLNAAIANFGNKMTEYAQYAMPGQNYNAKKAAKYYKYKNKYNEAKKQKNAILDKKAATRSKTKTSAKTFVNSFGEATTRHITTSTYERQQKKNAKQIMKFIGGK